MNKIGVDKCKLRFMIIPTRFCPTDYHESFQKAYQCWKQIWSQTFTQEMKLDHELYSDDFSRHTHVAILFYDNELACMTTLNCLDLTYEATWDDSYFKVWPDFTKAKLKKNNQKVLACCNLALDYKFRGGALGIRWKDFMFALLVKHLKSTSYDSMVAVVRLEKGMEQAAYRTGANPMARDLPYKIEARRIDIVQWRKDINENSIDEEIQNLVNYVWNEAFEFVDYGPIIINRGVKNVA